MAAALNKGARIGQTAPEISAETMTAAAALVAVSEAAVVAAALEYIPFFCHIRLDDSVKWEQ